ncbi:MAG TPA: PAS domain S-box protein [Chloroflexia bacterium]|nr:PAS domain S-box protein [Chloroflexia bacterium]
MQAASQEQQNRVMREGVAQEDARASMPLHSIANATTVLLAYVDREERFAFVNSAYAQWYGRAPEEIIGKHIAEIIGDKAYINAQPALEAALLGRNVNFEATVPCEGKGLRHLAISYVPDIDEHGVVHGLVATITDITESKETEADLRRKEDELRDFIENGTVGLHWVGPDGTILWVNRAELELLGYSEEEYLGHNIAEFHADRHVIEDILRRLNAKETLYNYEARLKAKDGSIKHILINSNVRWDEEGRFLHTRCFSRDVTERKRAEEALRESEERHRAVLEQVSEAIFLVDPESMRFVAANPAFQSLLGYTAEELLSMTIYDVLPYERERINRAVQRALSEGDYHVSDRLYRRKDGSLVNVEVGITPVFYSGKRVLCQIVRDITERKRSEEERNQLLLSEQAARTAAEEALRIRDELLAVVSHDLKNPLAAIKGNTQLMRRRLEQTSVPESGRLTSTLARIDEAQRKMNALINELMDFGRLQADLPLTLQRRPIDIVALVREVVEEQQHTTDRHNILIKTAIPEFKGRWDAERLERAISNLVSNAIKYSPQGGEVVVEIGRELDSDSAPGGWMTVTVRDAGLGISPEDLPHIFEWFRRAGSIAGRISGAGIGLASSLHTVRQHGGTIEVESEPGVGSSFTIRLPVNP